MINLVTHLPTTIRLAKKILTGMCFIAFLGNSQICTADATSDAESIFDNFLLPMQLSAFNEINKSYSEQPELKEGLEFINAVDFPSIFVNIRPGMIEIIKSKK